MSTFTGRNRCGEELPHLGIAVGRRVHHVAPVAPLGAAVDEDDAPLGSRARERLGVQARPGKRCVTGVRRGVAARGHRRGGLGPRRARARRQDETRARRSPRRSHRLPTLRAPRASGSSSRPRRSARRLTPSGASRPSRMARLAARYSMVRRIPWASPPIWSGTAREKVIRTCVASQSCIPCSGCAPAPQARNGGHGAERAASVRADAHEPGHPLGERERLEPVAELRARPDRRDAHGPVVNHRAAPDALQERGRPVRVDAVDLAAQGSR